MYGKRVRPAVRADQHRIALRIVARVLGLRHHLHQAAITVVRFAGRNSLRDDRRLRVLAEVDHLRAGVGLLRVVRQRDRVKFADRIVALQNARRIFPGDRRTCFDLRPRDFRIATRALAALGHEVVNAALAFFVARVPVLHGRIFDLRIVQRDQLDHRRVQLVRVELRRRAAFVIGNVAPSSATISVRSNCPDSAC